MIFGMHCLQMESDSQGHQAIRAGHLWEAETHCEILSDTELHEIQNASQQNGFCLDVTVLEAGEWLLQAQKAGSGH